MNVKTLFCEASRFFLPERCQTCGQFLLGADDICEKCINDAQTIDGNLCSLCGKELDFEYELETIESYICGECRKSPPGFDQFRSAFYYKKTVRKLLHSLKFESKSALAKPLAKMAKPMFENWPPMKETDMIIPVPLSAKKLWRRGYNPAYLLATVIFSGHKISIKEGALRRVRDTAPQYSLKPADRKKNVQKAFKLINPKIVKGKNVLLFDDIYTTGATVSECVKAIKKGKPKCLFVATLTRSAHLKDDSDPEEFY